MISGMSLACKVYFLPGLDMIWHEIHIVNQNYNSHTTKHLVLITEDTRKPDRWMFQESLVTKYVSVMTPKKFIIICMESIYV